MRQEMLQAMQAVVHEYAEGRGPLVKYSEMNEKIVKAVQQDSSLFRYLGCPDPIQWCERMQREARDGDTAYHYYQLAEMWRGRG